MRTPATLLMRARVDVAGGSCDRASRETLRVIKEAGKHADVGIMSEALAIRGEPLNS